VSYTQIAVLAVVAVVVVDLLVLRTRLLARRAFWVAYAIIVFFQLLTNGVLTGFRIVRYDGAAILGSSTPTSGAPPFLGDGRIAYAPVEDLLFGFALVVLTLVLWVWWGRRGVQRTPYAGPPPRWWPVGGAFGATPPRRPPPDDDDGGAGSR
jgi:hypothetical protein